MIFTAENTLLIGSILLFVSIVVVKTGYPLRSAHFITIPCSRNAIRK